MVKRKNQVLLDSDSSNSESSGSDLETELLSLAKKKKTTKSDEDSPTEESTKKATAAYSDSDTSSGSDDDWDAKGNKNVPKKKKKTKTAPKRTVSKSTDDESSDEEEPEKNNKSSEPEEGEVSDSDESDSDSSDSQEEFNDGYDENLMGDEEDQNRLAQMTEKEREQEIFKRIEQREVMKTRFEIEKKLRLAKKQEMKKKKGSTTIRKKEERMDPKERSKERKKTVEENRGKVDKKAQAMNLLKARREERKEREEKEKQQKIEQDEALKWVQQNIVTFGGDPTNVTIFGYSAGGASVTLHMVSPQSKGLFHRAIAMSGSFTSGWALNRNPKSLATRLVNYLGCPSTDSRLIYTCLMSHTADEIVNASYQIKDFELTPIALFAPVIELATESDRFLPEDPLVLIRDGHFAQVPFVTGITRDEFAVRGYYVLQNSSLTEEFNYRFSELAPIELMYERSGEKSCNISAQIRKYYLNDQSISNKTRTKFMQMYTDGLTTFSVIQTARLIAAKSSANVFLYLFNYQGRFSHYYLSGTQIPLGVAHHDDLIYLFYISKMFPKFNSTDSDASMVRALTSMWTSFAASGVPSNPCKKTQWQPLKRGDDKFLLIDRCSQMVSGVPFPQRMALWNSLFPLSGPRQQYY